MRDAYSRLFQTKFRRPWHFGPLLGSARIHKERLMAQDNQTPVFRRYEDSDHAQVMALHEIAMQRTGAWLGPRPWDDDLNDIQQHYPARGGLFLVGVIENRVVVMGAFRRITDTCAEIKRMRVHPDLQGHGLGQMMIAMLEFEARSMGYSALILETGLKQVAAQHLCRKNGFVETHRATVGYGKPCIWFKKDLTESV